MYAAGALRNLGDHSRALGGIGVRTAARHGASLTSNPPSAADRMLQAPIVWSKCRCALALAHADRRADACSWRRTA